MVFKLTYEGKIIGNNQRYAYRSKKINTQVYENFKTEIGWLCKQQNKNKPMLDGKVEIMLLYNSGLDIDNLMKGILDGLQGIVYKNDSQIKRARIEECKQIEKGFFMVISPLSKDNTCTNSNAVSTNVST